MSRSVAKIEFAQAIRISRNGCEATIREIRACEGHRLVVDTERRYFTIDDREYPYAIVASIDYDTPAHVCSDCGEQFDDAQGLGGHRLHRHGGKKGGKAQ